MGWGVNLKVLLRDAPMNQNIWVLFIYKVFKKGGGGQTIETAEITNFCNLTRHHQELCAENDKATKTWETETSKQYGQFLNRPDSF